MISRLTSEAAVDADSAKLDDLQGPRLTYKYADLTDTIVTAVNE